MNMRAKVIACFVIVCFYVFLYVGGLLWAPIIPDGWEWYQSVWGTFLLCVYLLALISCCAKSIKWVIK